MQPHCVVNLPRGALRQAEHPALSLLVFVTPALRSHTFAWQPGLHQVHHEASGAASCDRPSIVVAVQVNTAFAYVACSESLRVTVSDSSSLTSQSTDQLANYWPRWGGGGGGGGLQGCA